MVDEGAPDPVLVPLVAGVPARLALVQRSTVVERQRDAPLSAADDTVIALEEPAVAVQMLDQVELAAVLETLRV